MSGFPVNVVHLGELASAGWPKDTDSTFWCDAPAGCPAGADLKRISAAELAGYVRSGMEGFGQPSWTTVAADFTQPQVGGSVTILAVNTAWMTVGAPLRIATGTYIVQSVDSPTSVTLLLLYTDAPTPPPGALTWDAAGAVWDDPTRTWDSTDDEPSPPPEGSWDTAETAWDDPGRTWD